MGFRKRERIKRKRDGGRISFLVLRCIVIAAKGGSMLSRCASHVSMLMSSKPILVLTDTGSPSAPENNKIKTKH